MVLVHSFYLLGAVNFVRGVVAQDFPGSQPLSRLANGFIVEYADDPQTHSVVSSPLLISILRSGGGMALTKSLWRVLAIWSSHVPCCCLVTRHSGWHVSAAEQFGYGQSR